MGSTAELYEDFGDVHAVDFKTWWTTGDRGARLFAEPAVTSSVIPLLPSDISAIQDSWESGSQLVIAIPLTFSKRAILSHVKTILQKRHKRGRGQRVMKDSKAEYPVSAQFRVSSLKTDLEAYDLRLREPDLKLWQIAQRLRFSAKLSENDINVAEKKAAMSVAAFRKLAHAKRVIDAVAKGRFPVP